MKSPIVIFGFNRPDAFKRMTDSLKRNIGFEGHPIYVYIDGPRNSEDSPKIDKVALIARELTPNVVLSPENRGLGASIINGVSEVIARHGKAIVLEDDLVLMPGFLQYLEAALQTYADDKRVFSICGYGLKINRPKQYVGDVYLCNRSSSWGWATWADRWQSVDWNVGDWDELTSSKRLQKAFNKGGSDMYRMLRDYMAGRNKSWAIRFCYSQFRQGKYSVHPFRSLVANEGFGADATNCKQKYSRFQTELNDETQDLVLPVNMEPDERILKSSARYHSLRLRIYSKFRRILNI